MATNGSETPASWTPQEFELMNQAGFAAVSGQSEVTVARWRREGNGPAYLKLGRRVMYRRVDVQAWLNNQLVRNTAEYKAKKRIG